jgi:hypothetical protein
MHWMHSTSANPAGRHDGDEVIERCTRSGGLASTRWSSPPRQQRTGASGGVGLRPLVHIDPEGFPRDQVRDIAPLKRRGDTPSSRWSRPHLPSSLRTAGSPNKAALCTLATASQAHLAQPLTAFGKCDYLACQASATTPVPGSAADTPHATRHSGCARRGAADAATPGILVSRHPDR